MAKADLLALAQKAKEALHRDSKLVRAELNRAQHVFIVRDADIKREILSQLGRSKMTPLQNQRLDEIISEYTVGMYESFKFRTSKVFTYKVTGAPPDYYVAITSSDPNSDIFRKIAAIRAEKNRLKKLKDKVKSYVFPRADKGSLKHLFDIGHTEGHSVAEIRIQEALARFSVMPAKVSAPTELQTIIDIAVRSYETPDSNKVFVIEVKDESYSKNRAKGTQEKAMLDEARAAVGKFVSEYKGWATQGGSRSAVEIVISELLTVTKKHKGRAKGKITPKSNPSKANVKLKGKPTKTTTTRESIGKVDKVGDDPATPTTNWLSVVEIINAKLRDRIISNMQVPALQNRTGTLASSAKVVGVEITKEGYPSFVFNYSRNPYDVFDRTLGRAPWNTPERDPRTLVDRSIREIAKELAISRFYTRRA